jgi:hypothetical protein
MSWYRARNDYFPRRRINSENSQILDRYALGTHATGHANTLRNASACASAAAADRTRPPGR